MSVSIATDKEFIIGELYSVKNASLDVNWVAPLHVIKGMKSNSGLPAPAVFKLLETEIKKKQISMTLRSFMQKHLGVAPKTIDDLLKELIGTPDTAIPFQPFAAVRKELQLVIACIIAVEKSSMLRLADGFLGALVNPPLGLTPLHWAYAAGNQRFIDAAEKSLCDVRNEFGWTPPQMAQANQPNAHVT